MHIVLIGFMGAGKSTVAKELHRLMHLPYIEMDELVCKKTGVPTMQELFALKGEICLREAEIALAKEYAAQNRLIVSTGGGIVLNKIALDYFKLAGSKIFFLNAGFDTIVKRVVDDRSRPLFTHTPSAKQLYDFRLPLYLHYADTVIPVDTLSANAIARQIKEIAADGL